MQTGNEAYEQAKANIPPKLLQAFREAAWKTSLDVLAHLAHTKGDTDTRIHESQLIVTAALVSYFMHGFEAGNGRIPGFVKEKL